MIPYQMPSLGADMESGFLREWKVRPGDTVKRGDIIAEVETQKGIIDIEVFDDGIVGQQIFAGETTRLAYGTDEAVEGRDSFLEKRDPDWSPFPYHY